MVEAFLVGLEVHELCAYAGHLKVQIMSADRLVVSLFGLHEGDICRIDIANSSVALHVNDTRDYGSLERGCWLFRRNRTLLALTRAVYSK
jgi:hypothetical protein